MTSASVVVSGSGSACALAVSLDDDAYRATVRSLLTALTAAPWAAPLALAGAGAAPVGYGAGLRALGALPPPLLALAPPWALAGGAQRRRLTARQRALARDAARATAGGGAREEVLESGTDAPGKRCRNAACGAKGRVKELLMATRYGRLLHHALSYYCFAYIILNLMRIF